MVDSGICDFRGLYEKVRPENNIQFTPLWHYTSADGLTGIVGDSSSQRKKLHFWFTRSDCLNDPSEGKDILSLFSKISYELCEQNCISESFYELIKCSEIPNSQFLNFPIPNQKVNSHMSVLDLAPCHAFICSFSLKEDSLDMWRYYSKGNGGYGLKFFSSLFDKYKDYEYSDYDENALFCVLRSYKVIYAIEEKKNILKSIITDTFAAFSNSIDSEEEKRKAAKGFIQYALKTFQFQFKHECYSSEQEFRFVIYVPDSKPNLLKNDLPPIQYRKQNGVLVPYIDLIVDDDYSYLDEVLISPFIENKYVLATTRDYLSQCGFNCTVRVSQLPARQ